MNKKFKLLCILSSGAFTPITEEGNIVVNDVLASCYASVDHDLAHIGVTPIRRFPMMIELVFGKDNGLSIYASSTEDMSKWLFLAGNPMENSMIKK